MQIYGNHALRPGHADEVGHHLGAYGRAGADLAILTGIAVVGNHGCDAPGAGPLEGVQHKAELHQVTVDVWRTRGLHHKNIIATDIVTDFNTQLTVAERRRQRRGELTAQMVADALGQFRIGRTGDDL